MIDLGKINNTKMKKIPLASVWVPVWIVLTFVLGACGPGEIQPLTFQPAVWSDGEVSEYSVTDVNGNYAGTLRFDIVRGDGEDAWHIRREIAAQGTQEIIAVDVEGSGFRPQSADQIRSSNQGQEQVRTQYEGTSAHLELTTRQDITTFERISIPSDVRDEMTLLMLVRALPLDQNYATRLNVFTPIQGSMERMTVSVQGREEVETPAGSYETWRITLEGRERSQRIQMWVAIEEPHPVVKFIDGRNRGTFEITGFQAGEP